MSAADISLRAVPGPMHRLRRLPLRALAAGSVAAAAIAAGAAWIAAPGASVSTDDAYVGADSTIVAPKLSGLIAHVLVRDNQKVRAGQPLIEIAPEDYLQARASAKAALDGALAALHEQDAREALADADVAAADAAEQAAAADAERADADGRRFGVLGAQGYVSKSQADQYRAAARSSLADLSKARAALAASRAQAMLTRQNRTSLAADVEKARAALALAEQNLGYTIVRAPVGGIVGDRQAQIGEYVQPGTRLLTLVPMNTLYVTANFKETQTARLLRGQKAEIRVDAMPHRVFSGTVESFAPGSGSEFALLPFEPANGNFTRIVQRVPVRIRLHADQPDLARLRPGLSADVTVEFGR